MKLRIPARVASHLLESQAGYTPESDPVLAATLNRIRDAKVRKDYSRQIEVTDPEELGVLQEYVETMQAAARDQAHDPDGLADLNSARAVLRALQRGAGA